MVALKEPFGELRRAIQDRLFDKMGDSVSNLARNWIPTLQTGLGKIAEQLNIGIRNALADLDTQASRNKMSTIFDNVAASIQPALNGINDLVQGFLSLSGVGSEFMLGGAQDFQGFAKSFREWAESPEGQQKFRDFLKESLDTFRDIIGVVRELGGVIKEIFAGSDETGESWLTSLRDTFQGWKEFLGTPEGQKSIKDFFADVKATVEGIVDALKLAHDIVDFFTPGEQEEPKPPEVWGATGNDGGETGYGTPGPVDPKAVDPSKTRKIPASQGGGTEYYNYDGERVDKHGNRLDHAGGIFPGVREGSIGDRVLDFADDTTMSPGENSEKPEGAPRGGRGGSFVMQNADNWFPEETAAKVGARLQGMTKQFASVHDSARTEIGEGVPTQFNFMQTGVDDFSTWFAGAGREGINDSLEGVATDTETGLTNATSQWGKFGASVDSVVTTTTGTGVLGKLRTAFSELPGFFSQIVSGVGSSLSSLATQFQGPINAVVDVLNSFGDVWNKVADKIGLPKWEPLEHVQAALSPGTSGGGFSKPLVGARAMGGPGGPVHGPGNGKDDRAGLYRLSRGEHVWTADEVRAAGGHEAMYQMRNSVLRGGGQQSRGDGFSEGGGIVSTSDPLDPIQMHLWDLVRSAIPSAILTSGKRFADVGAGFDYHMQGKAIDLGGPMQQIARWIYETYPQSAELIHWPLNGWQNLNDGAPFNFGSSTNAQHQDHVHWAADGFLTQLSDEEKQSLFDRVRSGIGSMFSGGKSFLIDNLLAKPLRGLADNVPDIPGLGEFGQIPKAFARKMADTVINWVTERFGGAGGTGEPVDYDPSWGVEHWRDMAKEAMRRVGFNPDDEQQVNAMLAQIKSESGGNPNIAQQVVDVNGTGEQAGVGLLQVIPSTYEAYRDPELPNNRRDPFSNMVAALRYYRNRYGNDLTTVWGKGHGYDQGGIFPHGTFGFNASGLPEAVLTNPQWKMFEAFIRQMPGMEQKLQALPMPVDSNGKPLDSGNPANFAGINPDGTPGPYGVPINPGVDTLPMVGEKAKERFTGAFQTGFNDLVSSTLDPLGIPDPRTLIPSEVTAYAGTLDSWHKARIASAQASAALSNSGYQAAAAPATGTANQVIRSNGNGSTSMASYDYSTTINLTPRDTNEAFRQAQQIADLRAIQHTATARG
ncbi:transglycosylase SLT domain-containing protein [Nocardia higoensis]|uniref:Transglycosylase SLT domain-containing protein n=2 Tax=Nocardia higoensis TaxID=228599 RepID=A0ABS0DIC2_9NOCA|nr:transglycosylase SLT domain-containing protein [Nocardia higoensis]